MAAGCCSAAANEQHQNYNILNEFGTTSLYNESIAHDSPDVHDSVLSACPTILWSLLQILKKISSFDGTISMLILCHDIRHITYVTFANLSLFSLHHRLTYTYNTYRCQSCHADMSLRTKLAYFAFRLPSFRFELHRSNF